MASPFHLTPTAAAAADDVYHRFARGSSTTTTTISSAAGGSSETEQRRQRRRRSRILAERTQTQTQTQICPAASRRGDANVNVNANVNANANHYDDDDYDDDDDDVRFSAWFAKEAADCDVHAAFAVTFQRLFYETNGEEEEEEEEATLPMWEALLEKAGLDRATLAQRVRRGRLDDFDHDAVRMAVRHLPSLLRNASSTSWWPLLGYVATHAVSSLPPPAMRRMRRVGSHSFSEGLLAAMAVPFFDVERKRAVRSGVAACVLDALAETVVVRARRGWTGDDEEEEEEEEEEQEEEREDEQQEDEQQETEETGGVLFGADVRQIVDILLTPGILPTLAKAMDTTVPALVADVADLLLSYSRVANTLPPLSPSFASSPSSTTRPLPNERLAQSSRLSRRRRQRDDGAHIVRFLRRADPNLRSDLLSRRFAPMETDPHPVEVHVRAHLAAGLHSDAASTCHVLETCGGIEMDAVERCWIYLLDAMHEEGWLLEEAEKEEKKENQKKEEKKKKEDNGVAVVVTLSTLRTGPVGRNAVLTYLRGVVAMAEERLSSHHHRHHHHHHHHHHHNHQHHRERELLCVKDSVRRAVLKFLIPKNFSEREALAIADDVSGAHRPPGLERAKGREGRTAVEVANYILASKPLYWEWNERVSWDPQEEEEEETEEEEEEEKEEGVEVENEGGNEQEEIDRESEQNSRGMCDKSDYRQANERMEQRIEEAYAIGAGVVDIPSIERTKHTPTSKREMKESDEDNQDEAPTPHQHNGIRDEENLDTAAAADNDDEDDDEEEEEEEEPVKTTQRDEHVHRAATIETFTYGHDDDVDVDEHDGGRYQRDKHDDDDDVPFEDCHEEPSAEEGRSSRVESMTSKLDNHSDDDDGDEHLRFDGGDERDDAHAYHRNVGNYSASDDYDDEDAAEADRRAAFQGDSDNGEESGEEVVEILDSTTDGDEEVDDDDGDVDMDETYRVDDDDEEEEEEEERVETLNEAVDKYIAANVVRESTDVTLEGCVGEPEPMDEERWDEEDAAGVNESEEEVGKEKDNGIDDEDNDIENEDADEEEKERKNEDMASGGYGGEPESMDEERGKEEDATGANEKEEEEEEDNGIDDEDNGIENEDADEEEKEHENEEEIPDGEESRDIQDGHETTFSAEASAENPDETTILVAAETESSGDHREGVTAAGMDTSKTHNPSERALDPLSDDRQIRLDLGGVSTERRSEALQFIEMSTKSGSTPQTPEALPNPFVDITSRRNIGQSDVQPDHLERDAPVIKPSLDEKEARAEDMTSEGVGDAPMEVDNENFVQTPSGSNEKACKDGDVTTTSMEIDEQKITSSETNVRGDDHDAAGYSSFDVGNPARSLSDTDDMNMADDEHESIDTEEDKRSLAEGSQQGETFDEDEVEPSNSPGILRAECSANDANDHDDKPSVLVAAAMSSQRQGSNFFQSFTPSRPFEFEEDMDSDEESSSEEKASEDDGYVPDAEATEEEHPDPRKDDKKRSAVDDDGYVPDAEATEEDKPKSNKKEEPLGTGIEDGYLPDGGHTTGGEEASEVEQCDNSSKRIARDVRFESVLETNIDDSVKAVVPLVETPLVEAATCQSIDEGYLPSDGLTEEEKMERSILSKNRATKPTSTQSVDDGYMPDGGLTEEERGEREERRRRATDSGYLPDGGHTTPGDATEEDQGDEEVNRVSQKVRRVATKEAIVVFQKGSASMPEKRSDDIIDEGYLPSAVEGTEEERSEEEDTTVHVNSHNRATTSVHDSRARSFEAGQGEAMASVLVSAALFSQQKGVEDVSSPAQDAVMNNASLSATSPDERNGILSFDDTCKAILPLESKSSRDSENQDRGITADIAMGEDLDAGNSVKSQEISQGEGITKESSEASEPTAIIDDKKEISPGAPEIEATATLETHTKDDEVDDHNLEYPSATKGETLAKETQDESTEQHIVNDKQIVGTLTLLAEESELALRCAEDPSTVVVTEKKAIEAVKEVITNSEKTNVIAHSAGNVTGLNEQNIPELEMVEGALTDKNISQPPKEENHENSSVEKSVKSALRQSKRRKSTGSPSSPHDVPTSIVTRNKRRRRTGLPPVPEEGTIANSTIVDSIRNVQDAMDNIVKMNDDDDDSSIASSVGSKDDDSVSIAHRTTIEQKDFIRDDGEFVYDESTPVKLEGNKPMRRPSVGSDDASVASTRSRRSARLRSKEKNPVMKAEPSDKNEYTSTPRRTRRSVAKDKVHDSENLSVGSNRSGRSKQSQNKDSSPQTKRQSSRRTPARKSIATDDAGDADTVTVASRKGKRKAENNESVSAIKSETKKSRNATKSTVQGGGEKDGTSGSASVSSSRGGKGRSSKKMSEGKTKEMNVLDAADDESRSRSSARPNTRATSLTRVGDNENAPSPAVSTGVRRSARNAKKKEHSIASDDEFKAEDSISMTSTGTRRLTRSAKKAKRSVGSTHNLRSSDMETRSHHHYQHE